MKIKKNNVKKMASVSLAALLFSGIYVPVANQAYAAGPLNPPKIQPYVEKEPEAIVKLPLDFETAIKKAVEYSITTKMAELQRETVQDNIDDLFNRYDTLFLIEDPDMLTGTLANMDIYSTTLTTTRDLLKRQKTVDSESLKITIAGLFNNIVQQLDTIELTNKKILQGDANVRLNQKKYDLGMLSKNDLDLAIAANKALKNDLMILNIKLDELFAELEKNTGILKIAETYEIVPLEMEYKEFVMEAEDLVRYKANIENYDISILAKKNEVEKKTTTFQNYPEIYNFQYLSYLAGNQPSAPTMDYKSTRDEKNVAELDMSQTIKNAKLNVDKNYANLQQLQQNIEIMSIEREKLAYQLKTLQAQYNLGMVAKNVYENTMISKMELENKLSGLKVQQKQLKLLFESPYFAGMGM
ncbi:TolC family protein [Proteocatella sphenisci]|uniref:hypothetical protein n=1 Tax=Proteocatella sphenisci TaxID=181070 RepID=UPI00048D442D|nr:hypothetical protein [Proteocatella sphenisci]